MKNYSRRSNRTGWTVKFVFSSIFFLSLLISCSKEVTHGDQKGSHIPREITLSSRIPLEINQFSSEKIISDVRENLYIIGGGTRLLKIKDLSEIEEINIQDAYPCEIVDISTDGFDIFLLDRMNRKIWTVKREMVIEEGFPIDGRPLLLSVSEKGLFSIIYSNRRELTIFTKDEKKQNEILLENELSEGDGASLLFYNDIIYLMDTKNSRIEIFSRFNPSQKQTLSIENPFSFALDKKENLFIVSEDGLICFSKETGRRITLIGGVSDALISIRNENLFVLTPKEKKVDVYKIIYTHPVPDDSDS
jgi:hypothetical protein